MKKFILGFLSGAVLFTTLGVLAIEFDIMPNPYKILINNQAKNIEGYNINGYSYFKLRDIGESTNAFDVDFKDDTIIIESKEKNMSNNQNIQPQPYGEGYTSDGLRIQTFDEDTSGKKWVYSYHVEEKIKAMGLKNYSIFSSGNDNTFLALYSGTEIILDNIPRSLGYISKLLIPLDYYEETLRPFIEGLAGE